MVERVIGPLPALGDRLVSECQAEGVRAIAARGVVTLALSGGSIATNFFPRLAGSAIDWSRAEFFWADERAVPPADPDSNYALAARLWLEPARVAPARVHRMKAEGADPMGAAADYAAELARVAGTPPRLDLVLLGIGPDGHVASLFPDHPLLTETERTVAFVTDSPKPPPRRMTLTLPVLTAASLVVIAASGAGKADIVREALENADSRLPAALVSRRAHRVLWLLDPPAASALSTRA